MRGLLRFTRNDILGFRHRERSVAIPKIVVSPPVQAAPPSNAGIATVVTLLRNDVRGKTEKINKK